VRTEPGLHSFCDALALPGDLDAFVAQIIEEADERKHQRTSLAA
jgi:hypothetical protein